MTLRERMGREASPSAASVRVVVLLRHEPGRDSVGLVLDQIRKRVPWVELLGRWRLRRVAS
jgi:hypothetical protein